MSRKKRAEQLEIEKLAVESSDIPPELIEKRSDRYYIRLSNGELRRLRIVKQEIPDNK